MTLEERMQAFIQLGERIKDLPADVRQQWYGRTGMHNNWFTPDNVQLALDTIAGYLREEELRRWVQSYAFDNVPPRKVGVLMAGNVPAASFHDVLCVLVSGHRLLARPHAQDPFLPGALTGLLTEVEPAFAGQVVFTERLNEADAFIAAGNKEISGYLQQYLGRKPHLIRRHRTACAILTGAESPEELQELGGDVFQYFGLGNRSVSKLLVPEGYSFDPFFESLQPYAAIIHHNRYVNNYDYNKSVYLVNQVPHLDNGFLLLTQSAELLSPVGVMYFDTYRGEAGLPGKISAMEPSCVLSADSWYAGSISFGKARRPQVWEYPGYADTMKFLLSLE
jgi:hypothetical protein